MIFEQVDLVDVEEPAVRPRKQPRFEGFYARCERAFDIERAADSILRSSQRQIDYGHMPGRVRQSSALFQPLPAFRAHSDRVFRVASVEAAFYFLDEREQIGKTSDGGRFGRTAMSHNHHAAYSRVDHVQDERKFHLFLSYDGGEGIEGGFAADGIWD